MGSSERREFQRYTHTEVQAFVALRRYPEFACIPDDALRTEIAACTPLMPIPSSDSRLNEAYCEVLFDLNAVSDYLLRTHGFRCVSCGCHTDWNARGIISSYILKSVAKQRQSSSGPALICQPCAVALDRLVDPANPKCGSLCIEMLTRAKTGIRTDGFGAVAVTQENAVTR
jgi:hypothetical protein